MKASKRAGRAARAADEAEAQERWGDSPAWRESRRRTAGWTKDDWARMKTDMRAVVERIAAGMDRGPADQEVQDAIRAYHEFIDQRFYTCPASMFLGLSDLWGEDERYAAYFEGVAPGLAAFAREAVRVYVEELLLVEERY
jgi:MerR family transcriptional regulator, thiopeptide resistance regulator